MTKRKTKTGRPKGLPKTGGRKIGTPNKSNVRMRERFAESGFDFSAEFITAYSSLTSVGKMEVLLKMAPYFMQRLREDTEEVPAAPPAPTDLNGLPEQDLAKIPTSQLLEHLTKPHGPGGGN